MKTKVQVIHDIEQEKAKKGDIGYIDGYTMGSDGRLYASVVIKDFISLIPVYLLKVIEYPTSY